MSKTVIKDIAAAVVRRPDGKVLLLKRAPTHTTNPDKWCFVTGYIEADESPHDAAIRELREELQIGGVPSRSGGVVVVKVSDELVLHVTPFLFEVEDGPVVLDREHTACVWIEPSEVTDYDIVQQLDDDLRSLRLL